MSSSQSFIFTSREHQPAIFWKARRQMAEIEIPAHYRQQFERAGLTRIRSHLQRGILVGERGNFAALWIDEKDKEADDESRRVAKSAKNAAWVAAIAAVIACLAAVFGAVFS